MVNTVKKMRLPCRLFTLFSCFSCVVFLCCVSAVSAQAQDADTRLDRLENEIQTLSRAVFRGEAPPPGSLAVGDGVSAAQTANTELRLQQIERELRTLTGKVEQQDYELQQIRMNNERTLAALQARLDALESASLSSLSAPAAPLPSDEPPPAGNPAADAAVTANTVATGLNAADLVQPATPAPETTPGVAGQLGTLRTPAPGASAGALARLPAIDDPVAAYERAFALLREARYDEAETAFQGFVDTYNSHDLAANARYWLGETFYVRGNFERAARVFAEAYQAHPAGPKAPDNLLKLGLSLAGLGKADDACVTYAQIRKEFPTGAMPIMTRAEREMEQLGCTQF